MNDPVRFYHQSGRQPATGWKAAFAWLIPPSFRSTIRFELHMFLVRLRALGLRKRFQQKRDLLLNIGSGGSGRDGWVNIDAVKHPNVQCAIDLRYPLPFADASVRGIFTEHLLEHLDYVNDVPAFLRECHRVLQEDGVMRVIVPDAGRYLLGYSQGGWDALAQIRPLDAGHRDSYFGITYRTPMELINVIFRQGNEHQFAYDAETLIAAFESAGFSEVRQMRYGESLDPVLVIDKEKRRSESLYVDARR